MRAMVARLALAALTIAGIAPSRAWADEPAPALVTVELFTSQGCSSCPAADHILSELAARPDVLALSLSVDYWDYLGWRDTLARPENTKRQFAYARSLHTYRPYTPQIIIDGRVDVVGNNKSKVEWAIDDREKRRTPPLSISFEPSADAVAVLLGAGPAVEATVWLVRYADHVTVTVEHGENRGHSLTYTNVVQSMTPIGMWSGARARFVLPRRDLLTLDQGSIPQGLAIIVQTEGTGPILGAAKLPLN